MPRKLNDLEHDPDPSVLPVDCAPDALRQVRSNGKQVPCRCVVDSIPVPTTRGSCSPSRSVSVVRTPSAPHAPSSSCARAMRRTRHGNSTSTRASSTTAISRARMRRPTSAPTEPSPSMPPPDGSGRSPAPMASRSRGTRGPSSITAFTDSIFSTSARTRLTSTSSASATRRPGSR